MVTEHVRLQRSLRRHCRHVAIFGMAGLRVSKNGSDPNYLFGMGGGFEFAKLVRIRAIFSGWQGAPSSQKWFGSELFFRNGNGIRVRKDGSDPNYFSGCRGLRVRKNGSDPNYFF